VGPVQPIAPARGQKGKNYREKSTKRGAVGLKLCVYVTGW